MTYDQTHLRVIDSLRNIYVLNAKYIVLIQKKIYTHKELNSVQQYRLFSLKFLKIVKFNGSNHCARVLKSSNSKHCNFFFI